MDISRLWEHYPEQIFQWLQENGNMAWALGIASIVTFFGTLAILVAAIVILPSDHFVDKPGKKRWIPIHNPFLLGLYYIFKNIVGVFFVLAGLVMLITPGQGLLSLLIGVSLTSFPGKRKLVCRIVRQKTVLRTANWIRRKFNRSPLQSPA